MNVLTTPTDSNFLPDATASAITAIDFAYWQWRGIETICVDLDSTLLPHGGVELDTDNLRALQNQPLPIIIATNRLGAEGVRKIVRELDTAAIITADSWLTKKPSRAYFQKLTIASGHTAAQTLMIGDRIVQDIWGANHAGLRTVMVEKLGHQPWREKIFGAIDRWAMAKIADRYK